MDLQFILKDKFRLAVIEELSAGEMSAERIAKKNRLPALAVERAIRELRAEEIVGGPETELYLTDVGKEMLRRIRDLDKVSPGGPNAKARSREPNKLSGEDSRKRRENRGS